jgi:chitin disaccharide deacetylase
MSDEADAHSPMKKVIVTGDDFGLALPVNEAIVGAHQSGVLTTASLMAGEIFAQDAIEKARQHPSLKVGLHLVVVEGRPVSEPNRIPDLVDNNGCFSSNLTRAGFKYFFHPGIRRQLEVEIRAQFESFCRTGLALDHVNAHNHMHFHPTVLRLILKVGKEYGLKAVRLPNEPPIRSWKAAKKSPGSRMCSWIFLYPWLCVMKGLLRNAGVRHNDFLFGMADSGSMTLDLALAFIRTLPAGVTELCFHPATGRSAEIDSTMPCYQHQEEFKALTSKALMNSFQQSGVQRIAFSDL